MILLTASDSALNVHGRHPVPGLWTDVYTSMCIFGRMGRTNVVVDDELVEKVKRMYGLKTPRGDRLRVAQRGGPTRTKQGDLGDRGHGLGWRHGRDARW